jgi:hypothetical protein
LIVQIPPAFSKAIFCPSGDQFGARPWIGWPPEPIRQLSPVPSAFTRQSADAPDLEDAKAMR